MKNIVFYFIIFSMFFSTVLFAIDPPYNCYEELNCGTRRYPFKFCNTITGEIENICVEDPYNITEEELEPWPYPRDEYNFVPMKLNLPYVWILTHLQICLLFRVVK